MPVYGISCPRLPLSLFLPFSLPFPFEHQRTLMQSRSRNFRWRKFPRQKTSMFWVRFRKTPATGTDRHAWRSQNPSVDGRFSTSAESLRQALTPTDNPGNRNGPTRLALSETFRRRKDFRLGRIEPLGPDAGRQPRRQERNDTPGALKILPPAEGFPPRPNHSARP